MAANAVRIQALQQPGHVEHPVICQFHYAEQVRRRDAAVAEGVAQVQAAHGKRDPLAGEVPELPVVARRPGLGNGHVPQAVDVGVDEVARFGLGPRVGDVTPVLRIARGHGGFGGEAVEYALVHGISVFGQIHPFVID